MQRTKNDDDDDYRNRGKCNEAQTGDQTYGTRACPKEHRASTWHLLLMWCRSWQPRGLCLFCCGGWTQCEMQCLPQLLRRGGKPCNHVWFSPLRRLVLLNTLEVCVFVCVFETNTLNILGFLIHKVERHSLNSIKIMNKSCNLLCELQV